MKRRSTEERVTFSPGEFAALFGKSQTWGYRQIYAGRIKAITEFGRIQIPAAEVRRVLESAGVYNGGPQKPKMKTEMQKLLPELGGAWRSYLERGRESPHDRSEVAVSTIQDSADGRARALERLTKAGSRARTG